MQNVELVHRKETTSPAAVRVAISSRELINAPGYLVLFFADALFDLFPLDALFELVLPLVAFFAGAVDFLAGADFFAGVDFAAVLAAVFFAGADAAFFAGALALLVFFAGVAFLAGAADFLAGAAVFLAAVDLAAVFDLAVGIFFSFWEFGLKKLSTTFC